MLNRRRLLTLVGSGVAMAVCPPAMTEMSEEEGFVDIVGGKLRYFAAGRGETLVLLHKLGGRIQEWRRVIPDLGQHYRVIALDLAGHGQSQMHGPPPFIVRQETVAAQVMGVLEALGAPHPYRFVGSSIGGCVAVVCAAFWPEKVCAVASLGSALGGSVTRADLKKAKADAIAQGQFDEQENPLPRPAAYARRVFGVHEEAIAREQNESRAEAGRWIGPATRGVGLFDYLSALSRVQAPVLLAWGERGGYGRYVTPALERLTNGSEAAIAGSGAFPHEEAPGATSLLLQSFFGEVDCKSK